MELSEVKNDPSYIMYRLKCISVCKAKRELTLGKEYNAMLFRDPEPFFYITTDYGGTAALCIWRFELISKTDIRTAKEYNGIL